MTATPVLLVDDDAEALEYLGLVLSGDGYRVRKARDGLEALLAIESEPPRLVVSDLRMPEIDGLELLTRVGQRWPSIRLIMLTVENDTATVVEAMRRGAANYLVKPVAPAALRAAVRRTLGVVPDTATPCSAIPEIVGRSRAIVDVRQWVSLGARSDVNVLILGETGTGKELVARALHRCSSQSDGPLVTHNCAATPSDLFESEFFGHQRGAFTGANRDHTGLLERADGGSLLLDELESLSLDHQAKLLRVLDDGEVRPVGSSVTRRVVVRFIAATNRDPEQLVREGALREDLYYRLRGFQISLPPLRERSEDVLLLADHFLGGKASLSAGARELLLRSPWRGNVRELRSVVIAASSLARDGEINVGDLRLDLPSASQSRSKRAEFGVSSMLDAERETIVHALRAFGGNRTRAARALGIDRSTLRRKIGQLGIPPPGS